MPFYELECKKCGHDYDIMSTMSAREENIKKAKCPDCGSKSKISLVSATNFAFSNPEGTDKFNNSHDYRFKHKMEKPGGVKEQRKMAEAVSKMGTDPYGDADIKKFGQKIDDITSGDNFGEVK